MDIYRREANSRGQVSERQPLRNAAFLQQSSKEQKRLKRRSGRAVAHAGLEEKKEKKQKKTADGWSSEIAIESQAAWHFPHDPWRPNRASAPMFPCSCPHRPGAGSIGHAAASSGPSARPSGCLGQMEASGPWTRLRSQAALGGCRMKDGHLSQLRGRPTTGAGGL